MCTVAAVARIEVAHRVKAPIEEVWPILAALETHVEWMKDADSLHFTGPERRGVGTRMEVGTRVGPFRTNDVLEVIGWDEGRSITVTHLGLVRGEGVLSLASDEDGSTMVSWVEHLHFPWWLGGPVTAWLTRPILARIWRGNLDRFAARFNAP